VPKRLFRAYVTHLLAITLHRLVREERERLKIAAMNRRAA
jgi:hypothetical protein